MTLEQLGWNPFFWDASGNFFNQNLIPARVTEAYYNRYKTISVHGETLVALTGKLRAECESAGNYPVTGDWLMIEGAAAHVLLPRRTVLARKSVGKQTAGQTICANMDRVLVVGALDGEWNPRRIERFLTAGWNSGATPAVVLNKRDACGDWEAALAETEASAPGVEVLAVSARDGGGMDELARLIPPCATAVMIGSSGVGKSSLLNTLAGTVLRDTGDVHAATSQGRHTTSSRGLFFLPNGGMMIDTPGLRELGLWAEEDALSGVFSDIIEIAAGCRYRDCMHENEPDCAVREALANGSITRGHYENYLKQRREIAYVERMADPRLERENREKWKKINKFQKEIEKHGKRKI
ncbi:MAG: ribosome small subunit-dependent GTPase A [Spirochaetes bacterium GWF1_51_8]|nr:MAG: ribosome small subunit-dependent GTPase A [Spirochaetes bacterium GWF1_51_8]